MLSWSRSHALKTYRVMFTKRTLSVNGHSFLVLGLWLLEGKIIESFINIILNLVQNSTEYCRKNQGNSQECALKIRLKNQISLKYKS